MSVYRPVWLLLSGLAGCSGAELVRLRPADLEFSDDSLDFGTLSAGGTAARTLMIHNRGQVNLGLLDLQLASAARTDRATQGAFTLTYDLAEMTYPRGEPVFPDGEVVDTADDPHAPGDTAGDTGMAEEGEEDPTVRFAAVLPPGASLPLHLEFSPVERGENLDALVLTTGELQEGGPISSRVYRDVDTVWKMAYLRGATTVEVGNAVLTPRTEDMGLVWPGQEERRVIALHNRGDGPLVVREVALMEGRCSEGFSLANAPSPGAMIPPGGRSAVEVVYHNSASATPPAECRVVVGTDDADSPALQAVFRVNLGGLTGNHCPTVQLHAPLAGALHPGMGPVPMDLTLFDADQPASTLSCWVRSNAHTPASLASCTPDSESGRVQVEVPIADFLSPGVETLMVQVTDAAGCTRTASVPLLLAATWPEGDSDGDGYPPDGALRDCDDKSVAVYPGATEIFDGLDNDCDRRVDEDTDASDDDGDGQRELDGDCDDGRDATYRGAPEIRDHADNDCDGLVDEHTTGHDDDGDGYSEVEMDCRDDDPEVSPGAVELCGDALDNDCNGYTDHQETCLDRAQAPMLVGQIQLSRTAIEVGEQVQLSVKVHDPDGDVLRHTWEVKDDQGMLDDPHADTVIWTAPSEIPDGYAGWVHRVNYLGEDETGHQVWDFAEVSVYPKGSLDRTIAFRVQNGCASVPWEAAGGLVGLASLLAWRRRRQ